MKLSDPVTSIPLIGPKNADNLKRLGIETIEDLLYHIPFRFEDFSQIVKLNELIPGKKVTICVKVDSIKNIFTKYKKRLTKASVSDDTGELEVVWFNQHYLTKNIKKGFIVNLSGKLGKFSGKPVFISPEYEILSREGEISVSNASRGLHTGGLVPIYPETYGISSKWLRSRINTLIKNRVLINNIKDFIPDIVLRENNLLELKEAFLRVHFPKSKEDYEKAVYRFAFEELFLLQLRSSIKKSDWDDRKIYKKLDIEGKKEKIEKFIKSLPFILTNSQKTAVYEILDDLNKEKPMNRLLEGDVGSGKTVVSAVAIYASFLNSTKSCYMAPTEILAFQVFNALKEFLDGYGIKIGLLTSSKQIGFDEEEGKDPQLKLFKTEPDLIVGTHALLYNETRFESLGLVIIDEQHKFGVKQRAKLLNKTVLKKTPHLLTMTATPIPRSLALTLYGDLDLSIINELPKGRIPVKTFVVHKNKRRNCYEWVKKMVSEKNYQVFIVCPFIEDSEYETLKNVKAAKTEFNKLKKVFPNLKLDLLHGKLKSKEKNNIIQKFREQKIHILVSTPVVEVGMDIPNANIMIIEGAERYGLASLHQLRGRVGRGNTQGYCFLFTSKDKNDNLKRLRALEKYNDGLKLAEIDLKIRGPGEIFGTAQHGIPNLKVAKLTDAELINKTKNAADKVFNKLKSHKLLVEKMKKIEISEIEPN